MGLIHTLVLCGVKMGGYCYKSKIAVLLLGLGPSSYSPRGERHLFILHGRSAAPVHVHVVCTGLEEQQS